MRAMTQLPLFDTDGPRGLRYLQEFVSSQEEQELARQIAALPLSPFEFHGFVANRRTISFGLHYAFDGSGLKPAGAFPDFLETLRARAAGFAGVRPADLAHALVIEYAPGAAIGWHRDRPVFGKVVGISLLAPAPLRFRRKSGAKWERWTLTAEPRSAYLLAEEAREEWEHSIPPVEALRYSVTFRTLREHGP